MNLSVDISFGEDLVLDPDVVGKVAGVDRLGDLRDRHVRELSSFGNLHERDQRRYLMAVLRDSIRKRERLWLIPLTDERLEEWKQWLPADIFYVLGPKQRYEDEEVTPIGLTPIGVAEALVDRGQSDDLAFLRKALRDVDGLAVPTRLYRKLIIAGVCLRARSRFTRWITDPRVLAYIVVFIYSSLRALPVMFVRQFHGSIWVLWAIDLITAIPYTWGVLAMVTAAKFKTRVIGLVVTVVTFMLPYVYFGWHGRHYPPHIIFIIVALILGTFVLEATKIWWDRRVRKSLQWRRVPQPKMQKMLARHQQRIQRKLR